MHSFDIASYAGLYSRKVPTKGSDMKGLYDNINAKRERIKAGSGEKMRKPGTKGAPTDKAFKESAKTAFGMPKPKK